MILLLSCLAQQWIINFELQYLITKMISKDNKQVQQPHSIQIIDSAQYPRKRRSKNQQTGRDFVCDCGKSYLSYSALYTHSKVKHGQKITFQQSLYSNANNAKRMRPNFIDNDLIQLLEVQQKQYQLAFLQAFLQNVKNQLKEEYSKLSNPKKVRVNNMVFLEKYKKYWEGRNKDQEDYDGISFVITIDQTIGYYLTKLQKILQAEDFAFIQFFIMRFRNDVNQIKSNWRYTELITINDLPRQFNQIFLTKYRGLNDFFKENPTLVYMLLYHFASWLFAESFTTYRAKLNITVDEL